MISFLYTKINDINDFIVLFLTGFFFTNTQIDFQSLENFPRYTLFCKIWLLYKYFKKRLITPTVLWLRLINNQQTEFF